MFSSVRAIPAANSGRITLPGSQPYKLRSQMNWEET